MTSDEKAFSDEAPAAQRPGRDRHQEPPVIEGKANDETATPVEPNPTSPATAESAQPAAAEAGPMTSPAPSRLRTHAPLAGVAAAVLLAWAGIGLLAWQLSGMAARNTSAIARLADRVEQLPATAPPPAPTISPDQFASLAHRVEVLEQRPLPKPAETGPATESPAIATLQARMTVLENRVAETNPATQSATGAPAAAQQTAVAGPPVADLAPLEQKIDALDQRLAPLDQRSGTADRRIAALEASLDKLETILAAPKAEARVPQDPESRAAAASDRAGLAVIAQIIQAAVQAGRPFPKVYDAAAALGADAGVLADLKAVAITGAPGRDALARAFAQVSRATLAAAVSRGDGGGILDKLTASAASLVRVRPVGEVEGQDPPALVSRIEAALDRDDVAAALAAWQLLPAQAQAASASFADLARRRQAALAAANTLLDSAVATLAAPKGAK